MATKRCCMMESLAKGTSEISKTMPAESRSFNPDTRAELSKSRDVYSKKNPDTRAVVDAEKKGEATYKIENGRKCYYDDNGVLYRIDKDLLPNNSYELNGYKYQVDDHGRISSVSGKLHLKDHQGRLDIEDSKSDVGKGDERETDDRGHVIGDQFGGAPRLENLIPQDAKINQGIYKNLEDQLAKQVKKGKDVRIDIKLMYEGESRRPETIVFKYTIDGEKFVKFFPNDRSKL